MAKKHVGNISKSLLRQRFDFGTHDTTRYFPGHMAKGMKQIQQKLINVDCIIEVHDARIPISGRNPAFRDHVLVRPHVLLFNKMDLADLKHKNVIKQYYQDQGVAKVLFANCKEQVNHTIKKQIVPVVLDLIDSGPRYNRESAEDFQLLIIGVPNVGKSSLINAIRRNHLGKGKATKVGGEAGITRSVLERIKVCEHPPVYILDSPGILEPTIKDVETGMKLAVCANLKDHLVGEVMIADYILYWLNRHSITEYTHVFNLNRPTDDILELLSKVAVDENWFHLKKSITASGVSIKPDFNKAAKRVIHAFRTGQLGKVNLDEDLIQDIANNSMTRRTLDSQLYT